MAFSHDVSVSLAKKHGKQSYLCFVVMQFFHATCIFLHCNIQTGWAFHVLVCRNENTKLLISPKEIVFLGTFQTLAAI